MAVDKSSPYATVKALQKKADAYFEKAAQGNRSLNQYKAFIYQGKAHRLESMILKDEGNISLAKKLWDEAIFDFDLAIDRSADLGGNYFNQAKKLYSEMKTGSPFHRDPESLMHKRSVAIRRASGRRSLSRPRVPAFRGTSPRGKRRDPAPDELSSEAQELLFFLDNDEPLYRRKFDFLKNAYTKMKRGTYNRELARKLWMYYVEDAAKKYEKEFLNPGEWSRVFPPTVRREVAKELEERERVSIERGEYKDFPPVPARAGIKTMGGRKSRRPAVRRDSRRA